MTFIMITLSGLNCNPNTENIQDKYDAFIRSLQLHQLTCSCGHSACLFIHAYYTRSLKVLDRSVDLRICRVRCSACGKTHALMPAFIVPYSQMALPDQVEIVRGLEDGNHDFSSLMQRRPSITLKQLSAITSGTGGSVCFPSPFRLIPLRTSLPAVSCTINTSLCRLKKRSMSFLYKPHNHTRQPYFYLL